MVGLSAPTDAQTKALDAHAGSGNGPSAAAADALLDDSAASSSPRELAAAASFLEKYASRTGLAETIAGHVIAKDYLVATRTLADAYVVALGVPEPDAEAVASLDGCMQVLLMWSKECGMDKTLVTGISSDIVSSTSSPDLRLRSVCLLYNAASEEQGEVRFELLADTIDLAAKCGMVDRIENTVLSSIDRFLKQWGTSDVNKRKLYKACYEALLSAGRTAKAFSFNEKLLELYNNAEEGELASVQDAAVAAIVGAVKLPKLYRFDTLLELSAVKRLGTDACRANDSNLGLLFDLLNIFVKDDFDAFLQFAEKNTSFLDTMKIDKEAASSKMRLLTFASLAIDCQDLSYDVIAQALQIGEKEVEDWVIRSISSGLVDAKINQLRESVVVYRSTQRMFTREEWLPLSERINIWKTNVGELLVSLRETRQSSALAASEAFSGQ